MPEHVPLIIHGTTIDIHIFVSHPGSNAKARGLKPFLERLPPLHVRDALRKYLIFILEDKPRGGPGGGTWIPAQVLEAFRDREHVTGISNEDLMRLAVNPGKGVLGIPLNRWERNLRLLKFTVLHEVGHGVDYELNLTHARAGIRDFRGIRPSCGAGNQIKRRAIEAYSRFIINPNRICRDAVEGESTQTSNRRVIEHLRRSPAFRNIQPSWRPGQHIPQ